MAGFRRSARVARAIASDIAGIDARSLVGRFSRGLATLSGTVTPGDDATRRTIRSGRWWPAAAYVATHRLARDG